MGGKVGEWLFPDEGVVPGRNEEADSPFYRNRGYSDDGTVNLNRMINVMSPIGLFCCTIPDALDIDQTLCANIGI